MLKRTVLSLRVPDLTSRADSSTNDYISQYEM